MINNLARLVERLVLAREKLKTVWFKHSDMCAMSSRTPEKEAWLYEGYDCTCGAEDQQDVVDEVIKLLELDR